MSAPPRFERSKPRSSLPSSSSRGTLVCGEDDHCAYSTLATMNSGAQPSDAQGEDNVDGIERKGEETAHNDAQLSDAQGKDDVDGVERKGEETAHNNTRPSDAQGEDNVDGVEWKQEETAHNDA